MNFYKSFFGRYFILLALWGISTRVDASTAKCGNLLVFTWDDTQWITTETCEDQPGAVGRLALRNANDRGLSLIIWIFPAAQTKEQQLADSTAYLQRLADMLGRRNKTQRIAKTHSAGRFTWTNLKNTNPSGKVSDVHLAFSRAPDGRLVYVVHTFEPHRSSDPAAVKQEMLQRQFIEVLQKIQWQENRKSE